MHFQLGTCVVFPLAAYASVVAVPSMLGSSDEKLHSCLISAADQHGFNMSFPTETDFAVNHVHPYNLNLPYQPFTVAYPHTNTSVSAVVRCASKYNRKVQARSGGHDYVNKCIGGDDAAVILDMKHFSQLDIDEGGIATIGPGLVLEAAVIGLYEKRRYMSHGSYPTVGIGGHATVGGLGPTGRLNGPTSDAMIEAEVVLSDGRIVRASETVNSDLFWAIRGAGSNYGIVTDFKIRTKPEPPALLQFTFVVESQEPAVLVDFFKSLHQIISSRCLPHQLGASVVVGQGNLTISGIFLGTPEEFEVLNLANSIPHLSHAAVVPSLTWMEFMEATFDAALARPLGSQMYFHSRDMVVNYDSLPANESLDALIYHLQRADAETRNWMAMFDLQGGAANALPVNATAFPHRNAVYYFSVFIATEGPTSNKARSFVDQAMSLLQGNNSYQYLSYYAAPSPGTPIETYFGTNIHRLREIKKKFDPLGVFTTPMGI